MLRIMMWLSRLVLLGIIHLSHSTCVIDHRSLSQEWEKQLHKDLKCNYHWKETPNNENITEVKIMVIMKTFTLDSENDIFEMYSWVTLTWIDERLKWNPSDYGGLTRTTFWSYSYWLPILVQNNKKSDDLTSNFYGICRLKSEGLVVCVPRMRHQTQCLTKMADWPYDTQQCSLEYGIRKIQKNVRLVTKGQRVISMVGADYGPEWTIVDYEQKENVSDAVQLKMIFTLERNGEGLSAIILFPSILLAVITVSTLLIDVNDRNRLLMLLFSILCHFFYLSVIGWLIPKHSEDTPTVLLYFRFSLIFNMVLLVMSVILGKLRNKDSAPPSWMVTFKTMILDSYGKFFVWPRWDVDEALLANDLVNVKDVEVWTGFVNIVNSACLFVAVIVYSIVASVYIPKQPPFN